MRPHPRYGAACRIACWSHSYSASVPRFDSRSIIPPHNFFMVLSYASHEAKHHKAFLPSEPTASVEPRQMRWTPLVRTSDRYTPLQLQTPSTTSAHRSSQLPSRLLPTLDEGNHQARGAEPRRPWEVTIAHVFSLHTHDHPPSNPKT